MLVNYVSFGNIVLSILTKECCKHFSFLRSIFSMTVVAIEKWLTLMIIICLKNSKKCIAISIPPPRKILKILTFDLGDRFQKNSPMQYNRSS